MSQSPRKPQSKWGTPPDASGGLPHKPDSPAATPQEPVTPPPSSVPSTQPGPAQPPLTATATPAGAPPGAAPAPQAPLETVKEWLRHLSPAYVTLTVVSIGSVLFLALAMTSHTTPVAVLMSAGVVTILAFGLDTAICSIAAYQAGLREEAGHALLFAVLGGVSAVICALSMAGTLIMILVLAG
ncbi:MAG: hypothetical protein ACXWM8_04885 [Candidatus Limnocylindrales bacterium]